MVSDTRGDVLNSGSAVTQSAILIPPPTQNSYLLITIGFNTATATVVSITGGTGTFVKAAGMVSATRSLELWVGYNFGTSLPTSITMTRTAGTVSQVITVRTVDVFANCATAPSFTASTGNTGTSVSPDSGSLTPAVGDILFAGVVYALATASTARTHTGNTYLDNYASNAIASTRVESGWCEAATATSSKEVWTIASAEWAAIQVKWTPAAAPAATASLIVKGLTTAALDAASVF